MTGFRTDLAEEAARGVPPGSLPGLETREEVREGFSFFHVAIRDRECAEKLGKPIGRYLTFSLKKGYKDDKGGFQTACRLLAEGFRGFVPPDGSALVAGLGNRFITSDAVGPETVRYVMATRHLSETLPDHFGAIRRVAAVSPGVLGNTGIESSALLSGIVREIRPDFLIAVDALASSSAKRLLTTVQITDTGLVPGGGVGNARAELTREKLGIPVIAVGVPTVIYAASLFREAFGGRLPPQNAGFPFDDLVVTPREIDGAVEDLSRLIGYALDLALHPGMTLSDIAGYLS
ncbi:MAG: GPR endopeptidase [Clostridia bacterium]|nr:GPR endopeptidase [Clostridia bacterium]